MRNAPAYEVRNLRKVYRLPKQPDVVANDGLDFTVEPGEAFGLLGPNGAGKSTLVKQLVGLLVPSSGEVRLFGETVVPGGDRRIGRTVAYLPQSALALGELRVAEAIRWTGMLRGLPKALAESETEELLDVLQLSGLVDRQLRKLSGGQRRLVQLGMTLAARLPVLILDEPTADIDPGLRRRIWQLLEARARGGAAVLLVTHDVAEAEHVLDRVAILDRGRVVAGGTPAELKADLAHRTRLEIVLAEAAPVDARRLAAEMGAETRVRGRHISAWVPAELALRTLEKVMSGAPQGALEDVRLITPTLEDVYLEVGGHLLDEEETS
ncbi:MAG TPA: ABC transporter ATP-binding protein [Actinomycetota bacterium]|jgi:ABC-2 type transport system ATP-binding protein|nr:ABC transporter ATP-binding protein [Actinomycetota bacterium]